MCGITGFSRPAHSSIPDGRRFAVAGLLTIEDRGPDSTGVAWTRGRAEKVWYHKLVGPARRVAPKLDLGGRAPIRTLIGHTRWASQGAVNYTNAHPVVAEHPEHGSIVLVHNGCLTNDDDLCALAAMKRTGEVDSWALAGLLASAQDLGAAHPTELLEEVRGDAAIAWFNGNDPASLHLARLAGRPLSYGFTKRGDFVFASTRAALERLSKITDVRIDNITNVAEGTYLRVVAGRIVERGTIRLPQRKVYTPTLPMGTYRHYGITDRVADRPDDWWNDEADALLASANIPDDHFNWDDAAS